MRNPYDVLGVAKDADADTIRKAYRKLAREFHPDVNRDPKAEAKLKEINAANEIISDETKRKNWDEFGEASTQSGFDGDKARAWRAQAGAGRGSPYGGMDFDFGGATDMDDLLSGMFAGGGASRTRRGRDQRAKVRIDPMVALKGGEVSLRLERPNGETEPLSFKVPAGAANGGKIKLRGQGLPPRGGGPCGDLVLELDVAEHPLFRRDGDDLEIDVPITVFEAMKGGPITVTTPSGDVKLTIPAGSTNGTRLRIRGKGVPKPTPGDLYLVLRPTVPTTTDPALLAAAEALEAAYATPVRANLKF
jgi:curved DNA-binding protein